MPIDPNIAMGVRPIEQPNMLGQMAQAMQIRQANQEFDDINAMRGISAKYGGDISNPDFLKEVGMRNPKTAADLRAKALANDKTTGEIVKSRLETSRELLSNVRTPEEYLAWHQGNHKDPLLGPLLASKGITADTSMATIQESLKKPGGFEELLKKSAMGLEKFYADQTTQRGQNLTYGATTRGQDITDKRLREQFQYDIENPKMTPLAGEKVLSDGTKVPAYYGYDSRTNSMVEVAMPTVTVGPAINIPTPTNNLAPANVNALTMPPAGAPTSPVVRPATAAVPSAAAPSAVMPSAAAPTSVVPGAPNAPAPVRFGPKSTAENLTEAQGKATGFALRAKQASDVLDVVGKDGKVQPGVLKRVGESVPLVGEGLGTILNVTQTPQQQQVEQAQRAFVNAILRQESGAAVNESEFINAKKQYFPQPGDSKEVIDQKRLNRETAIKALEVAAGPGMKQVAPSTGIKIGTVEDGYRFKGGDPANKNNWEKQ